MSIGGVIILLLTTLRIAFKTGFTEGVNSISLLIRFFLYKTHLFLQQAYKPFTLSLLSAFVLFVCYKITGDRYMSMWISAAMSGVLSIGISAVINPGIAGFTLGLEPRHNKTYKAIRIILDEKHINNGGTLFICLVSLLLVLINYQTGYSWNAYTVLSLAASFAIGASGLLLCMHLYEFSGNHAADISDSQPVKSVTCSKILSNDRFDTLTGTLVAAMLLGTTMCDISAFQKLSIPASPLILPLALSIAGVGISSFTATLAKIKGWKKDPAAYLSEKMVSALLMITAAFAITQYLLPSFWVCNGTEYTSMQVFYAAQAGIIGGLLTNKVVQGYHALHRKYFSYLAKKSFRVSIMDSIFHFIINTISTLLPVVLIMLSILFSYELVGLYGIVIALIAMLANLSTQLTTGK
jgi:hypothetical protein